MIVSSMFLSLLWLPVLHVRCKPTIAMKPSTNGITARLDSPALLTHPRRDDLAQDPNDQSWITSWAAIGDSYSAGIGCGYLMDGSCARYNFSWPNLMNNDERMGDEPGRFQFLACSGATSQDILSNQIPQIKDGTQAITLTAGGNDADFAGILKACILGYRLVSTSDCSQRLAQAGNLMRSEEFNQSITNLLLAATSKLGDNGRLYYVGYAPFFNAESTQCNEVSWGSFFNWIDDTRLSTNLRTNMNVLVSQMNGILQDIARAAGDKVVYVDYSGYVEQVGGRFCEEDIQEPYGNNRDLFFYEWSTIDQWEKRDPTRDVDDQVSQEEGNTTFPGQIEAAIIGARAEDPNLEIRDIYADDTGFNASESLTNDPNKRSVGIMDGMKRIFHPTLVGHSMIANLVFYHMGAERAKMLSQDVEPAVSELSASCSLKDAKPQDGVIKPQKLNCQNDQDVAEAYWFDKDTARETTDNFCKYLGNKVKINKAESNIANAKSQTDGMGLSYSYWVKGPVNTYIDVWVQNAGCNRPTLYPSEKVCRQMLGAITTCQPDSTKQYGGSAAYSCEEYHMSIGMRFIKFAKVVGNGSPSWNGTSTSSADSNFPKANITLYRSDYHEM